MRLNRFYLPVDFNTDQIVLKDQALLQQWRNVLRLAVGENIVLFDGSGNEVEAEIMSLNKDYGELKITARRLNDAETKVHAILYCAILKKENFEWVVQKATEVGVSEIVPIITERTIKLGLKSERLALIIKEATEQSGRGVIPIIHDAQTFTEALLSAKANTQNFICQISSSTILEACEPVNSDLNIKPKIGIFIGPEGGWSDKEIEQAGAVGVQAISLGPRVLRGETAAIIASYLICSFQ